MSEIALKIIFLLFWIGTGVIRFPHDQQQKKNTIITNRKKGLEKYLLGGAFLGMMLVPLLYIFTPLFDFADYHLPIWLHVIGILLIPFTLWLFYRSHKDLGKNWSPSLEVRDEHTLVSNGVYAKVRHPMYASIWLWVIIQALLLNNYIAGLVGIISFGLLYFLRVPKEENMMLQQFGEQYTQYMQVTGRIIPKLR